MLLREVYRGAGGVASDKYTARKKYVSAISAGRPENYGFGQPFGLTLLFQRSVYVLLVRLRLTYTARIKPICKTEIQTASSIYCLS